ncbi:MAG: NUDIX domain-containing protein [Deltaproteobacteria bacterium]|nr:MAG: NUDIX domain-containing protein [Deltaproteobacteria bacterium]
MRDDHGLSPDEIARYRERVDQWARPSLTCDLIVFTVLDSELQVLLIKRGGAPFAGSWALPGGFVDVGNALDDQGEDLIDAAARELQEETGLPDGASWLEQLGAFGAPHRDPRLRVITVAYYALVRPDLAPLVTAGDDAAEARWFPLSEVPSPLAFDHDTILAAARARLSERVEHGDLLFRLVSPTFTVAELRAASDAVLGQPADPGNFRRTFRKWEREGRVEQAPGRRYVTRRPARVFRFVEDRDA